MPLTAKYATTCGVCSAPILPGEEITDIGGGRNRRWAHVTCPQGTLDLELTDPGVVDAVSPET
ncbi:MAG TPA: hypothetical protein VGW74_18030, partial [Propionibacteriaceae bacterium]|nr:hypothetical protein [Propionibacteriaceae bacterium]